ncbi:MAG: YgiQ family radical SAM protein [Rikenellaceae bacterium]
MGRLLATDFLPTTKKEVELKGYAELDIILFTGDSYVDHPSFGIAVIGRILENAGYRVAIVPQPSWRDDLRDFKKLGKPRLYFGVTSGNMDSMVNHYTAAKRLRSDDAYTAGGNAGMRPDYAVSVYSRILKDLYPDTPIVIGGIEASLRRLTHYDYWSDGLMKSILVDSKADILSYGMGDKSILEITTALENGYDRESIAKINQIAYKATKSEVEKFSTDDTIFLNSFEKCLKDKKSFGDNFVHIETESNKVNAKRLVEQSGEEYVVVNKPNPYLTTEELDATYKLAFTRKPHVKYSKRGQISAYEMIKYSVNMHRGCFGGCSFCTISAHQGKFISSRSVDSILEEIKQLTQDEDFKGYLSDIGGPSANMYNMGGKNRDLCAKCARPSCIFPKVCKNLDNDHKTLMELYDKIEKIKGIKKAFIGSGIRYDMIDDKNYYAYLERVIERHTSGRLKVAPEHTEDEVLKMMRKPPFDLFRKLNADFLSICAKKGLKYQLIPYFISSHPKCEFRDMQELHKKMKGLNFNLEQVQDFTPTPLTLSSVIYYTGVNPYNNERVFVERDMEKKKAQKGQFFDGRMREKRNFRYGKKK